VLMVAMVVFLWHMTGVFIDKLKLIGKDAPKDVAVHREEIYQRIQREKNENIGNR
jgi:carbon storage regulator CsrA